VTDSRLKYSTSALAHYRPLRSLKGTLLSETRVQVISVLATLGIWEWYGRGVDPIFLSYPTAIIAAFPPMILSGELPAALFTSLQSLFFGFTAAVVIGTLLGLLMGRYRFMDALLKIQVVSLYSTPNVALIPILILWFGLGIKSKIVIVFLSAVFPIIVNTYSGVRNVGRGLVEVVLVEGANERQVFSKVIIPASIPFVMAGIRLSVGRAVVGMVVAEMFTAVGGLGGAIIIYGNSYKMDKLFVVIIVLAMLGVTLTEVVRLVEKRMAQWKETERAS
jgi:ABC-type nitrate/sulfonate/bicarbonate transport system permease component